MSARDGLIESAVALAVELPTPVWEHHYAAVLAAVAEIERLREALQSIAVYRGEQDVGRRQVRADWRLMANRMEDMARRALGEGTSRVTATFAVAAVIGWGAFFVTLRLLREACDHAEWAMRRLAEREGQADD